MTVPWFLCCFLFFTEGDGELSKPFLKQKSIKYYQKILFFQFLIFFYFNQEKRVWTLLALSAG